MLVVSGYFELSVNRRFSLVFRFQTRDACQMRNQYKTGEDRANILKQPRLFECMGICVLSPAHESVMRVYLVCADCKILITPILFKFSHSILDWTALSWNFLRDFLKHFWRGLSPISFIGFM